MLRRRQAVLFFDDDADASWQWLFVSGVAPSETILAVIFDNAAHATVSAVLAVAAVVDTSASAAVVDGNVWLQAAAASVTLSVAGSFDLVVTSTSGLIGISEQDLITTLSGFGATLEVHND